MSELIFHQPYEKLLTLKRSDKKYRRTREFVGAIAINPHDGSQEVYWIDNALDISSKCRSIPIFDAIICFNAAMEVSLHPDGGFNDETMLSLQASGEITDASRQNAIDLARRGQGIWSRMQAEPKDNLQGIREHNMIAPPHLRLTKLTTSVNISPT